MSEFDSSWLLDGIDTEDEALLPIGGGTGGFIGPAFVNILYRFWTDVGGDVLNGTPETVGMKDTFPGLKAVPSGNGHQVYNRSYEEAVKAAEFVDAYKPQGVVNVELNPAQVISFTSEDVRAAWSSGIRGDATIKTWQSKKARHEFQMVFLPMFVAAIARSKNMEVEFDISELIDQGTVFDDATQARLIGDPDATPSDANTFRERIDLLTADGTSESTAYAQTYDELPIHYEHSILFRRRAELWKALGETNPKAYTVKRSARTDVSSLKLAACIKSLQSKWTKPQWVKMLLVNDPRVGAETKDGKRLSIPVIAEFYGSEAAAQAAWEIEKAERGIEGETASAPSKPPLPKVWIGAGEEDFLKELAERKGEPLARIAKDMSMTTDEVDAWLPFV